VDVFVLDIWEEGEPPRVLGVYSHSYLAQQAANGHAGRDLVWSREKDMYQESGVYRILPFTLDGLPATASALLRSGAGL
jgi:hypothetical protein